MAGENSEKLQLDEKMKAIEAAAKDFDDKEKEKVGEVVDDYEDKINTLVNSYNKKEINQDDITKALKDIATDIQNAPEEDDKDKAIKKRIETDNIITSIDDILFQLSKKSTPLESFLDPDVFSKRIEWVKAAYYDLYTQIRNGSFFKDIAEKNNWVDLSTMGISQEQIQKNFEEYFVPPENFENYYQKSDVKFQLQIKLFDGIIGLAGWWFTPDPWVPDILDIKIAGLPHTENEFKTIVKWTMFHELTHTIQRGKDQNNNNFSKNMENIDHRKEKLKIQWIDSPDKEIISNIAGMVKEGGAVMMSGMYTWVNDLSYNLGNVIAANYIFLQADNGEEIKDEFMRFSLNGRKMSDTEIDDLVIHLYMAINARPEIQLAIKTDKKTFNNNQANQNLLPLVESIFSEPRDLSFFKACCARPQETDAAFKKALLDAVTIMHIPPESVKKTVSGMLGNKGPAPENTWG